MTPLARPSRAASPTGIGLVVALDTYWTESGTLVCHLKPFFMGREKNRGSLLMAAGYLLDSSRFLMGDRLTPRSLAMGEVVWY